MADAIGPKGKPGTPGADYIPPHILKGRDHPLSGPPGPGYVYNEEKWLWEKESKNAVR